MTAPGIQSFAAIGILSEIGVDMSVLPTSKHLCSWAGLTPQNNENAEKRKPPESAEPGPISSPCWCSVRSARFVLKNSRKSAIAILHSRNAADIKRPLSLLPGCYSPPFTTCSRKMSRTILTFTARATGRLHTARFPWNKPSLFSRGLSGDCSTHRLDFLHNCIFRPLLGVLVLCVLF